MPAPELLLFMTEGMSLTKWRRSGVFDREIALYRALAEQCPVTIVSWAEADESAELDGITGMRVVSNQRGLSRKQFVEDLIAHLHFDATDVVVKTNQMKGAHFAARFAQSRGLPLIVRCGYLLSDFVRRKRSFNPLWKQYRMMRTIQYERAAYAAADLAVVSTESMRQQIIRDYALDPADVRVVPNYVDTSVFSPSKADRNAARIIYIGRLEAQKNLGELIRACIALPWAELDVVGDGSLREHLEILARPAGERIRFLGQRPNTELPALLGSASVFVLPSLYEGHPKSLIEAMSTGIACLGASSPGIKEVIEHEHTGYLCHPTHTAIKTSLETLYHHRNLCQTIGSNGSRYALQRYSLEAVRELEIQNIFRHTTKTPIKKGITNEKANNR